MTNPRYDDDLKRAIESRDGVVLAERVVDLLVALDDAEGPHCDRCGNAIDPDTCHCGEAVTAHAGGFDSHAPVPMGCSCGYKPDWKAIANSRGELLWKQRQELADAKATIAAYEKQLGQAGLL